jgi:integrase
VLFDFSWLKKKNAEKQGGAKIKSKLNYEETMIVKYKDWINEWLFDYVKPTTKERTYHKYLRQAQTYIIPHLGEYETDELSAQILQKFTVGLAGQGLAANTVKGVIAVVRSSLKKAVMLGIVNREFTSSIYLPKAREKKIDCLTLDEQRKIEHYILHSKNLKLFGVVFCLYTGLRIGELLALKWEDIDLHTGVVVISKTCMDAWRNGKYVKILLPPKTEMSNRVIPLPKQLLPKMKELKKASDCEYFICGRGEYGSQVRSYQKTFEKLLKKLKMPHKGFHSLRHTFATRALECGMDIKTLSDILGHKNPAVTLNRYAHSLLEHKADMMNRLGKLLSE